MGNMRFKVGDRVRIKSLDWYNMHCDDVGNVNCGWEIFEKEMKPYLGKVFTIHRIVDNSKYEMEEAFDFFFFTDEMIEGLAEEEVGLVDSLSSRWVNEFELPDGYIFKDENGNVINTTKIVLEKKKKEYPKTYDECLKIMGVKLSDCYIQGYKSPLLEDLQELLICRDAYWKIAGEEMGLGKPWEPDWNNGELKWCMSYSGNYIEFDQYKSKHHTLAFPTAEMRDVFYENFKEDIEICKELL